MARMTVEQQAQGIYDSSRMSDAAIRMMGAPRPGSIEAATLDEIMAHVEACRAAEVAVSGRTDATGAVFGTAIQPGTIQTWGKTADELLALAETNYRKWAHRAGVRGLKAKYGDDAARRIVKQHSGRTIR